jgi:hypothetical protein
MAREPDALGLLITFCSLLWEKNKHSHEFSMAYTEEWAIKLFNGFRRYTTMEHRCVLYTDRQRKLPDHIEQVVQPDLGKNGYGDCVRPYEMNVPMILVGLDTLFMGNIDEYCRWCLEHPGKLALPKHPNETFSINGVQFFGGHNPDIFGKWRGENDMDWMRSFPHERIDELWPGHVGSYRNHVHGKKNIKMPRIIYFHGRLKFNELIGKEKLIDDNWK